MNRLFRAPMCSGASGDPVALGLVSNSAKPGGTITSVTEIQRFVPSYSPFQKDDQIRWRLVEECHSALTATKTIATGILAADGIDGRLPAGPARDIKNKKVRNGRKNKGRDRSRPTSRCVGLV